MSNLSPRLFKGSIVLVDQKNIEKKQVIEFQYNPATLSRTLQVQSVGEGSGDNSEPLRLPGPPVETIKLDVEIDAADLIEPADTTTGILPQLAALEIILYPSSSVLEKNKIIAGSGTLEITPMEEPLTLFIWNFDRTIPVRLTEYSVAEEAFDQNLYPVRAKVSLGMRVLSINDLGFDHKGSSLYMTYQKGKENKRLKIFEDIRHL